MRQQRTTHPELVISPHCQLLGCGSKRGSRWNLAALTLVNDPARPKARKTPTPIRAHVGRAYHHKWWNILPAAARQQSACLTCVDYCCKGQAQRRGDSPLSGATGSGVCPGSYIRSASLGKFWRTAGADEDAIVASARCNFSHCEAEGARRGLLERCRAGARREARSEQATDEEERLLAPLI